MDRVLTLDLRKYIDTHLFGDRPHVRGRSVMVSEIARSAREKGQDISRLMNEFRLSESQVLAALLYYTEHQDTIDAQSPSADADKKVKTAAFNAATKEFREGLSEEEWNEIVEDMLSEYVEPEDPTLFDWIDDLPEDER